MALLRFDLPPRRLAGIYSRGRSQGARISGPLPPAKRYRSWARFRPLRSLSGSGAWTILCSGRGSFGLNSHRPFATDCGISRASMSPVRNLFPLVEAIDHAALLAEIVAGTRSDSQLQNLQIYPDAVL